MKNKKEKLIFLNIQKIYTFFSNRNLLMWPKSIDTIINDISVEIDYNYKNIIASYLSMLNIKEFILKNNYFFKKDFYNFSNQINEYTNNQINEYNQLCNTNKNALRKLYRISSLNYIYAFLDENKIFFPEKINDLILTVSSINFINKNQKFNNYLKKYLLYQIINYYSDNKLFNEYYKYSRFLFLYKKIQIEKLIPILYDNNNGYLYFEIPILNNKGIKKEQIIDRLYKNNNNYATVDIEEVDIFINTIYGKIGRIINNKKVYISDHINYKVPNIIRIIIHNLLYKFINKKYKYSYNQMLGFIFKNNFLVENYCQKEDNNGFKLLCPVNNNWLSISSKEIRKMTINDIDYSLLMNNYDDILSSILQFLINVKSF